LGEKKKELLTLRRARKFPARKNFQNKHPCFFGHGNSFNLRIKKAMTERKKLNNKNQITDMREKMQGNRIVDVNATWFIESGNSRT
jgi:hypothetical protein